MASAEKRALDDEASGEEDLLAKRARTGRSSAPWERVGKSAKKGEDEDEEPQMDLESPDAASEAEHASQAGDPEPLGEEGDDDGILEEYEPTGEELERSKGKGKGAGSGTIEMKSLGKRIHWLNSTGGFDGSIYFNDVSRLAEGLPAKKVFDILRHVEENRDTINDATRWVCSALTKVRRQGGGSDSAAGASAVDADKIQRRIRWLNTRGGFDDKIQDRRVMEVAKDVPLPKVMEILKGLEDEGTNVKDPTAWLCGAFRKSGREQGDQHQERRAPPPPRRPPSPRRAPAPPREPRREEPPSGAFDKELRRRIAWLNKDGGFDNGIFYLKVADACEGLEDDFVWEVLDNLLDTGAEEIRDPTGWACAGLTKIKKRLGVRGKGSGKGSDKGGGKGRRESGAGYDDERNYGGKGGRAGKDSAGGERRSDDGEDRPLKQRIGWLNGKGGFDNQLSFKKLAQLAAEQGTSDVIFQVLQRLENLPHRDDIEDPTGWVMAGAKKAISNRGAQDDRRHGEGRPDNANRRRPPPSPAPPRAPPAAGRRSLPPPPPPPPPPM